jgi:drug/metabolite transporter (DMT)-like permease
MMANTDLKSRASGLALVVLATACWSTSGIFINLIVDNSGITPVGLAFWRDIGSFCVLLVGLLVLRPDLLRVRREDLPWLLVMGAFSIGFFHVMWNTSVTTLGASVATVIQSNAPIFVTVMAWVFWKEPLTWRKITAIVLAVVGTILIARLDRVGITAGITAITPVGVLIGLAAAVAYASFSLFGKKLGGSYSSWTILVYVFGMASVVLFPFQFNSSSPFRESPTVLLNYAALVGLTTLLGFGLYTIALKRLHASVAAITANTEVPFAAVLAYIFLKERLDGWQVVGAGLIILGVVLISLPSAAQRRAEQPAAASQ